MRSGLILIFTTLMASISYCYMALSHKDWELPNLQIWLAEINIDRGLDVTIKIVM